MSKLPRVNNAKIQVVKGKEVLDEKGDRKCAFHVMLTRNPGEPIKVARQVSYDPQNCSWEVEFGEVDQLDEHSGGGSTTTPAQSEAVLPPSRRKDQSGPGIAATGIGGFTAATLDPVGATTNETKAIARWDYDTNQYKVTALSGECRYWWLTETGWWKHSSDCSQNWGWGDFTVTSNATYKNQWFCDANAITNVYYSGVTFKGNAAGGKQGWVNAMWDDGDCASLLWQNSYLQEEQPATQTW
ncbi:MAG TPA: hypothetical protein VGD58_02155 [Herpetosiphonaceae bacterium]